MRNFHISVPDDVIVDLRERLSRSRLLPDSPRRPETGMSSRYLRDLVDSWGAFDWSAREQWLNQHPQFIADVEGTSIHFVHLRSERSDAPALLVMHGWPHTFALQLECARLLPDFHVVVPEHARIRVLPPVRRHHDGERDGPLDAHADDRRARL